ncbi:hypothetical protein CHS0354_021807 [Potamilus streckersoni]|uniref:Ethylmalonyl-CoA decarboxylase n=1 Tax=Potamilus streckersoni TaxID=2493646 RepID=A0AAE0S4E9_9BIVA|nr:hypothetical protein CHS0354_021807 [Potamilus streckersoni]
MWLLYGNHLKNIQINLLKGRHGNVVVRSLASLYNETQQNLQKEFAKYKGGSVDLEKDEASGIAVILLNNPSKKNAMTGKMMSDLDDAVKELEDWRNGKGVILTGAEKSFCSGGDKSTVLQINTPLMGRLMSQYMHDITMRLFNIPLISVAAIKGFAIGGGAELATACDFRIMTASSKIGFVQKTVGLATGWGGGTRLVRLIGRTSALKLLSSGKVLDAESAKSIGLADEIIQEECDIVLEARKWLSGYCDGNAQVIQSAKSIVAEAAESNMAMSLDHERNVFSNLWGQDDMGPFKDNIKHK